MSFYLKKYIGRNGRTYLSIDTSTYSSEKKGSIHKSHMPLGSVESLKENGMDDPVAYYEEVVRKMNKDAKEAVAPKICDDPYIYLGYFPLRSIMERLDVQKYIDILSSPRRFNFSVYEVLADLVYARAVCPCSKYKTYTDVLPRMNANPRFSYDQLLECLDFIGENYSKIVEIFSIQVKEIYGIDLSVGYYDGTNFYFEIDQEDDFRHKGPGKDKPGQPIVGFGLLIDKRLLPVSMLIFSGNYPEKKTLADMIGKLNRQGIIVGRTIIVADKGINCAKNIELAIQSGNGYVFGKGVKQLSEAEIAWVLSNEKDPNNPDDSGYVYEFDENAELISKHKSVVATYTYEVKGKDEITHKFSAREKHIVTYSAALAKKQLREIERLADKAVKCTSSGARREEFGECGKYVVFVDDEGKTVQPKINEAAIQRDRDLAGYSMIITSETDMLDEKLIELYHNHTYIEENFKIMKSDISARPVFLHKETTIKGHFLVCYLYILLERIFQTIEIEPKNGLKRPFPYTTIVNFFKEFKVMEVEGKFANMLTPSPFVDYLVNELSKPLDNFILTQSQIDSILDVMTISQIREIKNKEAAQQRRPRGRPRKNKDTAAVQQVNVQKETTEKNTEQEVKKKRGRPKKSKPEE